MTGMVLAPNEMDCKVISSKFRYGRSQAMPSLQSFNAETKMRIFQGPGHHRTRPKYEHTTQLLLTSPHDRAREDLTVVSPPGPGGAATFLFGDVGGQHIITETGVVEIIVAFFLFFLGLIFI